jgi:plastocyanin
VAAEAAAATVTIEGFAYSPTTVSIRAGEAVAWTNADDAPHTATSTTGGCDTRSIAKGQTVALQFDTAGTYAYRCTIHPSMSQATVEVTS